MALSPARADSRADCVQQVDSAASIAGCTAVLARYATDRDHAIAYYNRGNAYLAREDFKLAVADYNKAIDRISDDADFYYNRAYALARLGDHAGAVADLDTAVSIRADFGEAYANRGVVRGLTGQREGSIDDYSQALDLLPERHEFYLIRGLAYEADSRLDRAIADYTAVIERIDVPAWVYFIRGVARGRNGEVADAAQDFEATIARNPDFSEAHYNLAVAYDMEGREPEALASYQRVAAIYADTTAAWRDAARRTIELGGTVPPGPPSRSASDHLQRGTEHQEAERLYLAIAEFDRAIASDPGGVEAPLERARALDDLGLPARALQAYRQVGRLMAADDSRRGAVLARIAELEAPPADTADSGDTAD